MSLSKKSICLALILFFAFISVSSAFETRKAGTLQSVATTDLSDAGKTVFAPGDFIRCNVSFSVPLVALVVARGSLSFAGAEKETLALQFETVPQGDGRLFWDSVVPAGADGAATLTVSYLSIPGGFEKKTASFTVSSSGAPPAEEASYIGSLACMGCHTAFHREIVDAYKESGHYSALSAVSGSAPEFPDFCAGVPSPPAGYSWDSISYLIGGFGWKAAFAASDGHVLTTGADGIDAQYNLPNSLLGTAAGFVSFDPDQEVPKPFDCGSCHTTGYEAIDNATGGGLITGTWHEDGVGCEACHGPGSTHRDNPSGVTPASDPDKACGACHIRDNVDLLEADRGLILHNQQAEELAAGGKSFFTCTSCHNAHASARYDGQAAGEAFVKECTDCHGDKTVGLGMQDLQCMDCHMPRAVQSGAFISFTDADGNALAMGDVRSHLFSINTAAASPADMFSPDGTSVAVDGSGKAQGLTLDFVCLGCHREGGSARSAYTFDQVKGFAEAVH